MRRLKLLDAGQRTPENVRVEQHGPDPLDRMVHYVRDLEMHRFRRSDYVIPVTGPYRSLWGASVTLRLPLCRTMADTTKFSCRGRIWTRFDTGCTTYGSPCSSAMASPGEPASITITFPPSANAPSASRRPDWAIESR